MTFAVVVCHFAIRAKSSIVINFHTAVCAKHGLYSPLVFWHSMVYEYYMTVVHKFQHKNSENNGNGDKTNTRDLSYCHYPAHQQNIGILPSISVRGNTAALWLFLCLNKYFYS
jgi:V8-like Glu-specific endopeptidase